MKLQINHVGLTVPVDLNSREMPSGKPLLHKDASSLGRKFVCNYMAAVGMLSFLQGYIQTEISMVVHQCVQFFNNLCLVHERVIRLITKYLVSTSTYVDLPYGNLRLYTCVIGYNIDK